MKKALKITLFSILGLVVIAGILVWMEFGPLIKGAMSCEKLDDGLSLTTDSITWNIKAMTVLTN